MSINQFLKQKNVKPADAIILNKKFFGMLDHYVIYLGIMELEHKFVANYIDGVKIIPNNEINSLLQTYVPSDIEKFPGSNHQRAEAIKRALSRIGEKAYNYVLNNCEHFKNYVHHGIEKSTQVEKAGIAMMLGGAATVLFGTSKKNTDTALIGVLIFVIGLIFMWVENGDDKNKKR
jgi:hypothetical protein